MRSDQESEGLNTEHFKCFLPPIRYLDISNQRLKYCYSPCVHCAFSTLYIPSHDITHETAQFDTSVISGDNQLWPRFIPHRWLGVSPFSL